MVVREDGLPMVTVVRELQEEKVLFPMVTTEEGKLIDANEVQPEKEELPKKLTDDGFANNTDVSLTQFENALFPMPVTLRAIDTVVRDVHEPKALLRMLPGGPVKIVTLVSFEEPPKNCEYANCTGAANVTRPERELKALLPTEFNDEGRVNEVRAPHPEKAELPTEFNDEGRVNEVRALHP